MTIWQILTRRLKKYENLAYFGSTLPGQAFQVIRPRQFESFVTAESGLSSYSPGGENHGPVGLGLNLVT